MTPWTLRGVGADDFVRDVMEGLARAGGNLGSADRAVGEILPMDAACRTVMVASSCAEELLFAACVIWNAVDWWHIVKGVSRRC